MSEQTSINFFGCELDNPFDFIDQDKFKCDYIYYTNAHQAITELNMWDWLRNFIPNEKDGFTFSKDETLKIIIDKIIGSDVGNGHSGASFGITMRKMHFIAQNGIDEFKKQWVEKNNNLENN